MFYMERFLYWTNFNCHTLPARFVSIPHLANCPFARWIIHCHFQRILSGMVTAPYKYTIVSLYYLYFVW